MSQSTSADDKPAILEQETLVDTDVHLAIAPDELRPYIDDPYAKRLESTRITSPLPRDGWDRTLFGKIDQKEELENVSTAERLQESLCEEFYVDYPIINTFALITRLPESDFAVALMEAYNDLLLDQFLDEYDHFYGMATLTSQKPHRAAEEIERLADEDQIVGAYIHSTGPNPPLGDSAYDVIYRAAEKNDLPIAYHASVNGFMYEFPRQNQSLERFLSTHVLAHAWSQMLTLTSLLVNGTPQKFPDLDFLFLEAGLGWVPYMMYRLNKEVSIRRSEAPLLEKSPEEYIRDQFAFASQPIGEPNNPSDMSDLIDMIGTESLVFASDYPHWDFDHPEALDKHLRRHFEADERKQVLHQNAADLLNLNI
ncbi:amidohydrolase family protein [Halobellus inordinatus]|uniref:amidohydrolase family protein n=1 Tax=Halobellus inordinatus TaxID=1126236 RepID=UPI00210B8591|nr:amidohydrolase family protein [Halobellus inordinatus]